MGAPAQQPVYYDTEQGQYYTNNNQQNTVATSGDGQVINNPYANSPNVLGTLFGFIPPSQNPLYASQMAQRNYLGSPYGSANPNRFITNAQATPYADLTNLFPSLNAGSMQGLISSPDGAMSGAGRFLSPQTNNTQGK